MTNGVPVDPEGPGEIPRPELSCNSTACVAALAEIVRLRNVIVFKCGQIAAAKSRANAMAAVATALATLAVALLVAGASACATFFGCLGGIVLIIAAAVLGILAVFVRALRSDRVCAGHPARHESNQAISDFTDAADAVHEGMSDIVLG